MWRLNRVGFSIDDLKVRLRIVVVCEYHDSLSRLCEWEELSLDTKEIYYDLIFPRVKQCKTIHDEVTTINLLQEQTLLNECRNDVKY